jgi:ATP-dependent Clp protease ATP-binding subunit ClpB
VILLDEIEKAHPDVFNILLQVLDDGRLTDNKGRVANFKNTIIIMTSNLGSDIIQQEFENLENKDRHQVIEETKQKVYELLKRSLKPEFLNRVDEVVMFEPLTREHVVEIVKLQMNKVIKNLEKQHIHLKVSDAAINKLAELGYDPQFGARPVKRVIQREILNELSKKILKKEVETGKYYLLDYQNDQFVYIEQEPPKQEDDDVETVAAEEVKE